jgi:hypothetical protein
MKTIALLGFLFLAGCSAEEINRIDPPLPINTNTWHVCSDGSSCPNWEDCPPPGYPRNGCEARVDVGPADNGDSLAGPMGRKLPRDAGADR